MTLDEFVAIMLIVALIPVTIIQWMGLIVAIIDGVRDWRKKTMIDYKKAAKAAKLLKESGVSYVLSYDNGENCTAITSMHGDWQSIEKCVTDVMVKILKVSRRGGMMTYDAACELREMVLKAMVIHIERAKKE